MGSEMCIRDRNCTQYHGEADVNRCGPQGDAHEHSANRRIIKLSGGSGKGFDHGTINWLVMGSRTLENSIWRPWCEDVFFWLGGVVGPPARH